MNIKELKEIIKDLPDDMLVSGYNDYGDLVSFSYWLVTEDTLTDEEKRDGYPDGVTPTFVISTD